MKLKRIKPIRSELRSAENGDILSDYMENPPKIWYAKLRSSLRSVQKGKSDPTVRFQSKLTLNPLNPHDALKHHFTSLKTDLISLQPGVLE